MPQGRRESARGSSLKEIQGVALQNEAAKGFWKVFWNKTISLG